MTLQMPHLKQPRPAACMVLVTALALAGGMSLSAGTAPIRLLGVSGQGNALLIEASEPAAYTVKRPDSLTILVELRNVSVASAANLVAGRDRITAVTLEQDNADDGRALARVRVTLSRPSEYAVRSVRNTIRLELTAPAAAAAVEPATPSPQSPASTPAAADPAPDAPAATILERVRASRSAAATTVTLSGNGRLTPADVTEADARPRRLVLDFPNVSSKAAPQTSIDGSLVTRVRSKRTASFSVQLTAWIVPPSSWFATPSGLTASPTSAAIARRFTRTVCVSSTSTATAQ